MINTQIPLFSVNSKKTFQRILGFIDSDGSIYGESRVKNINNPNKIPSFSSSIKLQVGQAIYNKGNVQAFAQFIDGTKQKVETFSRTANTKKRKKYARSTLVLGGKNGRRLLTLFQKKPPLSPNRRYQYLIANVILNQLPRGKNKDRVVIAQTIHLLRYLATRNKTRQTLKKHQQYLKLSVQENFSVSQVVATNFNNTQYSKNGVFVLRSLKSILNKLKEPGTAVETESILLNWISESLKTVPVNPKDNKEILVKLKELL